MNNSYGYNFQQNKGRSKVYNVIAYLSVALFVFSFIFIASNWNAYKSILNYYLNGESGKSNLFALYDNPNELAVPLKVGGTMGVNAGTRIKIDLQIPISPPDNRIIIPKFALSVPVNEIELEGGAIDQTVLDSQIQNALKSGVVLYPGTARPGTRGNSFITGHSSYYLWDPGKYKDVFALLPKIKVNDEIIVYYNQKKIRYRVSNIKEVWPSQVDVLKQTDDYRLTLMTCVPVGTNLRRLIVTAELVD